MVELRTSLFWKSVINEIIKFDNLKKTSKNISQIIENINKIQ